MPIYTFRNKDTGEEVDMMLSMSNKDAFLSDNLNMEQIITSAPALGDSVRLGIRKIDDGFRDVLHKVAERNPKSNLKNKLSRN